MLKLPSPLCGPDGSKLTDPALWPEQRQYLAHLLEQTMYGPWPGTDHQVVGIVRSVTTLWGGLALREDIILTVDDAFSFDVLLTCPAQGAQFPTIVYNVSPPLNKHEEIVRQAVSMGYAFAAYNREQIIPDGEPAPGAGPFAQLDCCDLMAWGWGASLVANYLEQRKLCGMLIATGHSRGGKACAAASVFDQRFAVCAPMGSGCGGMGCSRYIGTADGSRQDPTRCETVGRITRTFPRWFAPAYGAYGNHEGECPISALEDSLPVDCHTIRAAMAPRAIISSEGMEDHWSNPVGTQLGWMAAQEVFDFLGVPERNAFHTRGGGHDYADEDWLALLTFCQQLQGLPAPEGARELNVPVFDTTFDE